MKAKGPEPTQVKVPPAELPVKAYPGSTSGGTGVAGASSLRTPIGAPSSLGPMSTIREEQEEGDVVNLGGAGAASAAEQ
eukprot:4254454-Prorocentrum_lima.AAC.1